VSIVHGCRFRTDVSIKDWVMLLARFMKSLISKSYHPNRWMKIDKQVNVRWTLSLNAHWLDDGDIIFATSWETAEWVARYPARKGKKMYLIQHLEDWSGPRERVLKTWNLPLKKIAISKWLVQQANALGEQATFIPNGLG
jgi:hypothetical protein